MAVKIPAKNLVMENVRITYRNFAGNEGPYNPAGARSFSVYLDTLEQAQALEEMGWKIKYAAIREDGSEPLYPATMPVALKYHPKMAPPRVKLISKQGTKITNLDEEAIDVLDFADIEKVDMIVRPFHWTMKNGSEGVKTMLVSIYVTIREDELELKYADLQQAELEGRQQDALEAADVWEDLGEIKERKAIEAGF